MREPDVEDARRHSRARASTNENARPDEVGTGIFMTQS